ncbi:hypothetical protein J4Q44_G00393370 [Coregonus suidteri]|uniref:Uncharacterized protein n=1 Tax=Coregonus suidteri TaxID=861788 RepID=A0AAN8KDB3_9TELE
MHCKAINCRATAPDFPCLKPVRSLRTALKLKSKHASQRSSAICPGFRTQKNSHRCCSLQEGKWPHQGERQTPRDD